ncbi:hypothetical protein [Streptacidiphilus fuscans]|uniref:Peptidase C39-like domain-containing protein n=1 Tax=Streptacidiphilus fuscans TaxID=2789292 RepID=A0A931B5A4_9ACTN|nr:hypothetical protein [Streptacidiphilus fuscans]MBF9069667.1 hypothetical protein [Streptacidiphilus fuscans]
MIAQADVVHDVPYYAQWESPELVEAIIGGRLSAAEDPAWAASGAATPEEYAWWARRLCGMACLRMALHHVTGTRPPRALDLAGDYLRAGAYVKRDDGGLGGLIYAPFAAHTSARHPLQVDVRPELTLGEVASLVRGGSLVMLSVHPWVRTPERQPPQRGGHLVLAVGAGGAAAGTGADDDALFLHNPSGFAGRSQRFVRLTHAELEPFFAGRGVVLTGRTA